MIGMLPLVQAGLSASEVSAYFSALRSGQLNYKQEQQILTYSVEQLTEQLAAYYTDSVVSIRQKAYYLTYKKGLQSAHQSRTMAVTHLLRAIGDADGGIVGQVLRHLQEFSAQDFDDKCRAIINHKISYTTMPHYKELVLLAGYIDTGKDALHSVLLKANLPQRNKWYIALALSRMGDSAQIAYCMRKVEKLPVNSDLVSYVLPDLVYMRQKAAIDFCVNLLADDKKLCASQNPDMSEKINCAYLIIPLIAPAIADFPVAIDPSGDIAGNVEQALQKVRTWFAKNNEYTILKTTFR
ncbi:hypothetical protein AGMMS4956_20030 [Bacteroidia bacterium]|nr:hypothetical protein AGMMS4956_20030 [Bacteroidia bacterium]